MKFSIIVPFYKAGKFIEGCIQALLSQNVPPHLYEVIMVDNNTPDNSAEIVRRYPRIRLLSQQKQGSYAARNRGLEEATGEIIVFTDPDCVPSVDWLQNISRAMLSPDVGIVLGIRELPVHSSALSLLSVYENTKDAYVFSGHHKDLYFGYTNNMAVKRLLFEELGPFKELYRGADTIFLRQAVEAYGCSLVCYAPDVRVRHMEMTSILTFYQKILTYGHSNKRNKDFMSFRPLTHAEKFQIFRKTVAIGNFTLLQAAGLLGLLAVGNACQLLGRCRAILSASPRTAP